MFHTRREANRFRNFGLLLALVSVSFFYLWYKTGFFVFFLVGGWFLLGTFPLFRKYNIWMSGAKGEEKVAKCLKSLGGRYHVFNDVALPRTHSDIDHVVVAPNGFFLLYTQKQ